MAVVPVGVSGRSHINTRNTNLCPLIHGDRPVIDIYRTAFVSVFLVRNRSNVNLSKLILLVFLGALK